MREIKFRVYDKDLKSMHVCGENIHDTISFHQNNEAHYYNLQNGEGSGEHGSYELMQFTGSKDYKGEEIYEHDIFKFTESDYGIVSYFNGEWRVVNVYKGKKIANRRYDLHLALATIHGRVIGNIYENPELLEASN